MATDPRVFSDALSCVGCLSVPGEDRAGSEQGQGLRKQAPFHAQETWA